MTVNSEASKDCCLYIFLTIRLINFIRISILCKATARCVPNLIGSVTFGLNNDFRCVLCKR